MYPKGLILAVVIGVVAGPVFGIILFDLGTEEQLVFVEGDSLSIVTEKIDYKIDDKIKNENFAKISFIKLIKKYFSKKIRGFFK